MTDSKPIVDNKEKAKSRKKREPLDVHLATLDTLKYGDETLTGEDLAAHADALAAAKAAMGAIKATIEDADKVLRAAMRKHYCSVYAQTGHAPPMRRTFSKMSKFQCVQQSVANINEKKAATLKNSHGIDIDNHINGRTYTVSLGNASKEKTKEIVSYLKETLGDDYPDVVSEKMTVGEEFFSSFDSIVKKSLGDGERLDDKMLEVLRILSPTIQFSTFETDLEDQASFDLAHEFARISAKKTEAAKAAAKEAKASEKAKRKAVKDAERTAKREAKEAEREAKRAAKAAEKAERAAEKAASRAAKKDEKAKAKSA